MEVTISRIALGLGACYLIRHEGAILVDCGYPGRGGAFRRALSALGVSPGDVGLIVLTHGHADHVGSASEIAAMTGAKVAIHHADGPWLESGHSAPVRLVGALGRRFSPVATRIFSALPFRPLRADVIIGDEGLSLEPYGVPGEVLHTPGHTAGSISVVLRDGSAIVGDLAMGGLPPLRRHPGVPYVAEDLGLIAASWRLLLGRGIRAVYPGHGRPFAADDMRRIASGLLLQGEKDE